MLQVKNGTQMFVGAGVSSVRLAKSAVFVLRQAADC